MKLLRMLTRFLSMADACTCADCAKGGEDGHSHQDCPNGCGGGGAGV